MEKNRRKTIMKKKLALLVTGIMVLSLTACGGESAQTDNGGNTQAEQNEDAVAAAEAVSYTTTFSVNDENLDVLPDYQFIAGNAAGIMAYDSRTFLEITLNLDGAGNYEIDADFYVMESGLRQEVGADSGIGQTWKSVVTGTYEENADGTILCSAGNYMTLEVATDTYSSQLKDAIGFSVNGSSDDGSWTSEEAPEILESAPETIFEVNGDAIVTFYRANQEETLESEEPQTEGGEAEATADGNGVLEIVSDDTGTTFTLNSDGTYAFYFSAYDITDTGSYSFDGETLTITDKNGVVTTSSQDGDNVVFHYAYSDSDQLTGDYTVALADLTAALGE
jgi:hypothetical protein